MNGFYQEPQPVADLATFLWSLGGLLSAMILFIWWLDKKGWLPNIAYPYLVPPPMPPLPPPPPVPEWIGCTNSETDRVIREHERQTAYLLTLRRKEDIMKLVNLDQIEDTVFLGEIKMYDHFQLPSGNRKTVYMRLHDNKCAPNSAKVRCLTNGEIYNFDKDRRVYALDCELHYKRKVSGV